MPVVVLYVGIRTDEQPLFGKTPALPAPPTDSNTIYKDLMLPAPNRQSKPGGVSDCLTICLYLEAVNCSGGRLVCCSGNRAPISVRALQPAL